jgi:hypothetical protein
LYKIIYKKNKDKNVKKIQKFDRVIEVNEKEKKIKVIGP